jgi:hypothetical protein
VRQKGEYFGRHRSFAPATSAVQVLAAKKHGGRDLADAAVVRNNPITPRQAPAYIRDAARQGLMRLERHTVESGLFGP